jgi:thiol:disulfide interchange protein DsbD
LGRFGVPSRGSLTRWTARLACLGLLLGSAATVAWAGQPTPEDGERLVWQPWSEAAVAAAQAEGRPVFVDFTADWCFTCKVNERAFIDVAKVRAAVADADVVTLKADWTNEDPAITAALAEFGVASVPYYAFYAPDQAEAAVHFDSVFSSGKILDALELISRDGGG